MTHKIIVGVDFSDGSRQALTAAHEWAKRLEVPLAVVHVLHLPAPGTGGAPGVVSFPPAAPHGPGTGWDKTWKETTEAHALEFLNAWIKDYPDTTAKVVWGGPAEGLLGEADADTLIVLGSVGHSKLEHILFGSTAVKVVRHAPGDVLVVRGTRT